MKIQSYSDIITNSSSELFVFNNGESVGEVITKLNDIYPDWRTEYLEPKTIENTDTEYIEDMLSYIILYDVKEVEGEFYCKAHGIKPYYEDDDNAFYDADLTTEKFEPEHSAAKAFADMLGSTPDKVFKNWDKYNPFASWEEERDGLLETYPEISREGIMLYIEKYKNNVLLWSIDENPDWKYQEKIEKYAVRYHLG